MIWLIGIVILPIGPVMAIAPCYMTIIMMPAEQNAAKDYACNYTTPVMMVTMLIAPVVVVWTSAAPMPVKTRAMSSVLAPEFSKLAKFAMPNLLHIT